MGASAAIGGGVGEVGGSGGLLAESHANGVSKSVVKTSVSNPSIIKKVRVGFLLRHKNMTFLLFHKLSCACR